MKRLMLLEIAVVFALSPPMAGAESKPASPPKLTARTPSTAQNQHVTVRSDDGNPIKDSWITSKTKMSLVADKRVKARHITVETNAGVVSLRGKVSSASEQSAAQEIARGIHGVKAVSNVLQVVPDGQRKAVDAKDARLQSAVQTRIMSDNALRAANIHVRADNAVVTLMGEVPDGQGLARAGQIAHAVRGVKAVRNELRQQSVARPFDGETRG